MPSEWLSMKCSLAAPFRRGGTSTSGNHIARHRGPVAKQAGEGGGHWLWWRHLGVDPAVLEPRPRQTTRG